MTDELANLDAIAQADLVRTGEISALDVASNGWPIGSHFAAARGREATLLGLAYELEETVPWRHRRPSITASAKPASGSPRERP